MKTLAPLLLLPFIVLADVGDRQAGVYLGPIRDIDCGADAGLYCSRASASAIGKLQCVPATQTEPGCITPSSQTLGGGTKTFTGTVKAPLVDAGEVAVGTMDLVGNTIGGGAGASLTIASATADSVTSSTVAAFEFQCTAAITSTDLCWGIKDSGGIRRIGVTAGGNVNFTNLVTDTGAATVGGTGLTVAVGSGGPSSGVTVGGPGGALAITGGSGGASVSGANAGNGGAINITSGAGGVDNGVQLGGQGGALNLSSGPAGGGRNGGALTLFGANGGAANASHGSGLGGQVFVQTGRGGAAAAGGVGSASGDITLFVNTGGDGSATTAAGAGGAVTITSGGAGTNNGGGGAAAGSVTIDTGAPTGAGALGTITVGGTNSGTVTLGRSGQQIVPNGYGVLGSHGSTRMASEVGEGAMTGGVLAVTFATAFAGKPICVCTHVDTTNQNGCNVKTDATATVSGVSFRVLSGGTDFVEWICIGQR